MLAIYVSACESAGKMIDGDKKKTEKELRRMMEEETWLTAQEAYDLGFIDGFIEEEKQTMQTLAFARLRAQASTYKNLPNSLKQDMKKEEKKSILASLAAFFGFKAEISEDASGEQVTEQPNEAPTIEAAETEAVQQTEEAKKAEEMDAKLVELEEKINAKIKQLEELEAKAAAKISGKTETKAQKSDGTKYPSEIISQANDFVKSLFNK